ncbi:MAG: hypothetical protein MUC36_28945 [Planctomycetes bacterium]|jgi:hypothetical protein|nr:hypothetical protein [Planctomycetota bacterium]
MILPPLTIYFDESGTLNYTARPDGRSGARAHVVCAVAVPLQFEDALRVILPRDDKGDLLKHRDVSCEDMLCGFLEELLRREVAIVATQIDTGTAQSIEAARQNTELANQGRETAGIARRLRPAIHSYRLFLTQTLAYVMATTRLWGGELPTFLSIVMDENNHSAEDKDELKGWIVENSEKLGVRIQRPRWSNEGADPLLFLPDLVAGVLRDRGDGRPLRRSGELVTVAESRGLIQIIDGWKPYAKPAHESGEA